MLKTIAKKSEITKIIATCVGVKKKNPTEENIKAVKSGAKPFPIKAGKKAIENGTSNEILFATVKQKAQSKYFIKLL